VLKSHYASAPHILEIDDPPDSKRSGYENQASE
jgi:hypothetical protein